MNDVALVELMESTPVFARAYVALKTALLREGVEPEEAQDQARLAALWIGSYPEEPPDPWEVE